jgi:hypothetical protein
MIGAGGAISATSFNQSGGSVQGAGTIAGAYALSGGTITPGSLSTPGTLTINGNFTQTGGTLNELMNGTSNGILNVSGSLSLSGATLDILGNYDPAAGTILTIATSGSSTAGLTFGTIENDNFTGASGAEKWVVLDSGNNIELEAETAGPTDVTATWSTGSGSWNTATQWSCSPGTPTCVPNNSSSTLYDAVLNSSGQTLTLNSSAGPTTVSSVTIDAGSLNVQSGATLSTTGNFSNGGTLATTDAGQVIVGGNFNNASGAALNLETTSSGGGGGSVTVAGVFINNGAVTMAPESIQAGTLSAGSFENSGAIQVGEGNSLISKGDFDNNAGSSLVLSGGPDLGSTATIGGNFNNAGGATLQLSGDAIDASPVNVTVTGAFTNGAGGIVKLLADGDAITAASFSNSGSILVGGDLFGADELKSTGDFVNSAGGSLSLTGGGVVTVGGNFVNAGGSLSVVDSTATIGGNFNNAGGSTLQISETFISSNVTVVGVFTNGAGAAVNMTGSGDTLSAGSFVNSGSISLTGDFFGFGETLQSTGDFNNNAGGSLTLVEGTVNVGGNFNNNAGGTLTLYNATALTVGGNFNNAAGATLQYTDPPTTGNVTTVAGTFTNGGTVNMQGSGDSLTVAGVFTNSGSVVVGATETLNANGGYTNTGTTGVAGILNTTTYQQNAGSTDVSGTLNATNYQYGGGTTTVETGGRIAAANFTQTGGSIQGTGSIGTVGGAYTMTGGMITPGSSIVPTIGSLSVDGSYTQSGGTFDELIGPAGNGLLAVNGPVVLEDSATLEITLLSETTLSDDEMFDILNYTGTETGAFANAPSSGEFAMDGWNWDINYGFDGNEVVLTAVSAESVSTPEPSALLLLGAGLLALGAFYRRMRVEVKQPKVR